jgi:hypothetical protein
MPPFWQRRTENVHYRMSAIPTLGRNSPSPLPCFATSSISNKHGGLKLPFDESYILGYNIVQTGIKSATSQRKLLPVCLHGNPRRLHPEYEGNKILGLVSNDLPVDVASVMKTRIFIATTFMTSNLVSYHSLPAYLRWNTRWNVFPREREETIITCSAVFSEMTSTKISAF